MIRSAVVSVLSFKSTKYNFKNNQQQEPKRGIFTTYAVIAAQNSKKSKNQNTYFNKNL